MLDTKQLKALFEREYGREPGEIHCFFAPGRVNLIGEHIDYNGGYVFPVAITLGIYSALRWRQDRLVRLKSTNMALEVALDLNRPLEYCERDGWGNYPKGMIQYLLAGGQKLQGCDILFSGNLPDGTGLSSSAAMLVLTGFMLKYASGKTTVDRPALARLSQKVENEFVKVNCGIMDQFAVAMGRRDCAILLNCQTLEYKYIPFVLGEYSLVIMNTNKKRELTESRYNQRRTEAEQALTLLRQGRSLDNLCQASLDDVARLAADDVLRRRARHAVTEQSRVLKAADLLEQGDITGFGRLMIESHASMKNDYEISGPELDAIVDHALATPGCIGARMTGGGFGGCAIALVETARLESFQAAVAAGYQKSTSRTAAFYVAGISDGVNPL
ncbi:galactokinase [Acetonema longum]|nr:galactokinase [Acetonema longum]